MFVQRGWDSYMVYLFDKSKIVYDGPFASRSLSECVNYIGKYAEGHLGPESITSCGSRFALLISLCISKGSL